MLTSVSTCVHERYEALSLAPGHNLPLPFPFLFPQGELDPHGLSPPTTSLPTGCCWSGLESMNCGHQTELQGHPSCPVPLSLSIRVGRSPLSWEGADLLGVGLLVKGLGRQRGCLISISFLCLVGLLLLLFSLLCLNYTESLGRNGAVLDS